MNYPRAEKRRVEERGTTRTLCPQGVLSRCLHLLFSLCPSLFLSLCVQSVVVASKRQKEASDKDSSDLLATSSSSSSYSSCSLFSAIPSPCLEATTLLFVSLFTCLVFFSLFCNPPSPVSLSLFLSLSLSFFDILMRPLALTPDADGGHNLPESWAHLKMV